MPELLTVYVLRIRLDDSSPWGEPAYYRTRGERDDLERAGRCFGGVRTEAYEEVREAEEVERLLRLTKERCMTDEELCKTARDIVRGLVREADIVPRDDAFALVVLRGVASKARDGALDEAESVVLAEHLEDPQEDTDAAYDRAIDDAAAAVRSLKSGGA